LNEKTLNVERWHLALGILLMSPKVRPAWRWTATAAVAALTLLAFLLMPPDPVVERFAGEAQLGEGSRPALWSETLKAVPMYPLFGCGLGAFESALYRTSDIMHDRLIDYAHNDYLPLLVELGLVGFAIGAVLLAAVLLPVLCIASADPSSEKGALAIACVAAIAGISLNVSRWHVE
jgi:O-antigen ligase